MAYISFPLSYKRQFAQPLDLDTVFTETSARVAYLTSAIRYAGQIVADLEDGKVYVLNAAKNAWVAVGTGGSGTVTKATSSIGNGSDTSINYTHGLNSSALNVNVWDNFTGDLVFTSIQIISLDAIKLEFNAAPAIGQYKVVVTS